MKPRNLKVLGLSLLIIFLFIGCTKAPPLLQANGSDENESRGWI